MDHDNVSGSDDENNCQYINLEYSMPLALISFNQSRNKFTHVLRDHGVMESKRV